MARQHFIIVNIYLELNIVFLMVISKYWLLHVISTSEYPSVDWRPTALCVESGFLRKVSQLAGVKQALPFYSLPDSW